MSSLRRLVLLENPHAEVEVDVGCRYLPHLAGPGAGFHHGKDEFAEMPILNCSENVPPLLRRQDTIPMPLWRFLYRLNRIGLEQASASAQLKARLMEMIAFFGYPSSRDGRRAIG